MNCEITVTPTFRRALKRLSKRYKSIGEDVRMMVDRLRENPYEGADLGGGIRKIRLAIRSKGKGKRGGARVITYNVDVRENGIEIWLLTIYDKSDSETISDNELRTIIIRNGLVDR